MFFGNLRIRFFGVRTISPEGSRPPVKVRVKIRVEWEIFLWGNYPRTMIF